MIETPETNNARNEVVGKAEQTDSRREKRTGQNYFRKFTLPIDARPYG